MNRTSSPIVRRLSALTIAGALGLGFAAPAFAQTSTSTPTTSTSTSSTGRAARDADHQAKETARKTDLATRLGITVATIDNAEKTLAKEQVDAAVTAGTITAAQGTALKTQIDSGDKVRVPHSPRSDSTAQLTAAQRQAESDARLAKYVGLLGVTKDAYVKALSDQAKADVATKLGAGTITQAQATARIAMIDADAAAGQVGKGGHGGHGGFGGGKGGGRGGR